MGGVILSMLGSSDLGFRSRMACNSNSHENLNAAAVIDKLLDATQALLASIQNLKDMVETQRCSFQLFLEDKLLSHRAYMENSLDELREEVHSLSSWMAALEVSSSPSNRMAIGGRNPAAPAE